LREAALLRLRNPSASLRELAERSDPPTTKATMQRRLARVVELGEA
jgi:DNA-binding transcriptional regulator WhiA